MDTGCLHRIQVKIHEFSYFDDIDVAKCKHLMVSNLLINKAFFW